MDMLTLVLTYLGTIFFYAYLSMNLPEKFAPLKIGYLVASFFFVIVMFGSFAVILATPDITFTIPLNVTYNGTVYTDVNSTVTQSTYAKPFVDLFSIMLYGNAVILGLTVLYILIIIVRESLTPVQNVADQLDRG